MHFRKVFGYLGGIGILLIFLIILLSGGKRKKSKTKVLSREIIYSPDKLASLYHNTLKVDYLEPEDFQTNHETNLTSLTGRDLLKSKIIRAERLWVTNVNERNALSELESEWGQVKPWDQFSASFNCPHSLEKVGGLSDGKWVCGLELYEPQECVVYTFGSKSASFETEWLRSSHCSVLMFSPKMAAMNKHLSHPKLQVFPNINIHTKDILNFQTLRRIMQNNDHGWLDVMYFNLNGRERKILPHILADYDLVLPFAQIIIKFDIRNELDLANFRSLFEMLERRGLRAYHLEKSENENGGESLALEYSFLNLRGRHLLLVGN